MKQATIKIVKILPTYRLEVKCPYCSRIEYTVEKSAWLKIWECAHCEQEYSVHIDIVSLLKGFPHGDSLIPEPLKVHIATQVDPKPFTPPYRVGRKQRRAVLDANGRELVVFPAGLEDNAKEYCDFLNDPMRNFKYNRPTVDAFDRIKLLKSVRKRSYVMTKDNDVVRIDKVKKIPMATARSFGYMREFEAAHNVWSAIAKPAGSLPRWCTIGIDESFIIRKATEQEIKEFKWHQQLVGMNLSLLKTTKEYKLHNK